MNTALVITTIAKETLPAIRRYEDFCKFHGWKFYLIGDVRSADPYQLDDQSQYYSIARQEMLGLELPKHLGKNTYARKNIGYLAAMKNGADVIVETDDDNLPLDSFWDERKATVDGWWFLDQGWVNIASMFWLNDGKVWSRGFPLEHLNRTPVIGVPIANLFCPVQQGLVNGNPDVDAVFRFVHADRLPLEFRDKEEPIVLGRGSWHPINTQNTTWFKDAFQLLYFPSMCSWRVADIWKGFIAQRICWENDWNVMFHRPTVFQERNPHNILVDFEEEIPGYLNNSTIADELAALPLEKGTDAIDVNMRRCYGLFVKRGWIRDLELKLLDAWLHDVESIRKN